MCNLEVGVCGAVRFCNPHGTRLAGAREAVPMNGMMSSIFSPLLILVMMVPRLMMRPWQAAFLAGAHMTIGKVNRVRGFVGDQMMVPDETVNAWLALQACQRGVGA